jgi:hypothetical protein
VLPVAASAATVPVPAGGVAADNTSVRAISCPAAGSCGAVGTYTDSSGDQQELLLSQSGGAWTASKGDLSALPAPYGGPSFNDLFMSSIACPAAGDCVAVGSTTDTSEASDAVIEAEAGGQWLPAATANLPTNAITNGVNGGGFLNSIACTSPGNCVAVGTYADGSTADLRPLVATEVNGTWERGTDPGLPGDATASPGTQVDAVSCASAGNCAAVGNYDNSHGTQGLLLTESGGSWTASAMSTATLTAYPVASNPHVDLRSVSCPAAGACVAVGFYDTASGGSAGVVATESNGSWDTTAPDLSPLGYTSADELDLESVACPAAASCSAVGYLGTFNGPAGVVLRQSGGAWQPSFQGPSLGSSTQPLNYTFLHSISCATQGICAIAGFEDDVTAGEPVGVLLGGSADSWPYAKLPLNAPDPMGETGDDRAAVSCSTTGYCALVGSYASLADPSDTSEQQTLLAYAPGPSATVTAAGGVDQAAVSWVAPVDDGGLPVTGYTVTANDQSAPARGGQTITTTSTAVTFTGLTAADSYTFTVTANSLLGVGVGSSSTAVTIAAPAAARSQFTRAQIIATLKKVLAPTGKNATIKKIVKNNGFTFKYRALEAGRLVIDWYYVTNKEKGSGKHRHKVKVKTLVAKANVKITAAKSYSVKVKLTKAGRKLLKTHKRLKLTTQASFTPSGGKPITTTKTITLR